MNVTWAKFTWSARRQRWVFCGFTHFISAADAFMAECSREFILGKVVPLEDPDPVPRTKDVIVKGELL
jgi:hypothetical protein